MLIIVPLIRTILFKIDEVIFNFIVTVYNLLMSIANISVLENAIEPFFNRIYSLLCIFMLFKLSFSVLTYIINPDEFTDKNKGFTKIITNVIITLVLLVVIPRYAFNWAYKVQKAILDEEIIGNIIFGSSNDTSAATDNSAGKLLAFNTLLPFYHIDNQYSACQGIYDNSDNSTFDADDCVAQINGGRGTNGSTIVEKVQLAVQNNDVASYLDLDLVTARDANDNFIMSYTFIISTLAGVVVLLLLINFCFDVAIRTVKLGFLQLISPIPIISRLDPKKGKDVFDKWLKNCLSTYLDLFIRLVAIYFAIFVIDWFTKPGAIIVADSGEEAGFMLKAAIIIGALLFAKQLPKLISDMFGFDLTGKFNLNPMKRLNETGIPTAAGIGAAAIGSAAANMMATEGNIGKKLLSGIGGFGSATARGIVNGINDKGQKPFKTFSDTMMQTTSARVDRDTRQEAGLTWRDRVENTWDKYAGIKNKTGGYGKYNEMVKEYDRDIARMSQQYNADSLANNNYASSANISTSNVHNIRQTMYETMQQLYNNKSFDVKDDDPNIQAQKVQALEAMRTKAIADYKNANPNLTQQEEAYVERMAYEAFDFYNMEQTRKYRKDAADLTEKVNQVSKN